MVVYPGKAAIDTIAYAITNACGSATVTHIVTVNAAPNAGFISGPSNLCLASIITLTDPVAGGIWSMSNAHAIIVGGVVTSVTPGTDTAIYTVSNLSCTSTATKAIVIDSAANAGTIVGPSAVCTGSSITLTDLASGGTWSAGNANATVADGFVTGVTSGTDSIFYTMSNVCGTDTALKIITIDQTPGAGIITGPSSVCAGSSVTFTDTATGGAWSVSNANAAALGNIVLGVTAGADTVIYTVSSAFCTATATKAISIDPLPDAGSITGPSTVCMGSVITLTDTHAGGTWSSSNANDSVSGGMVTGLVAGIDTIMYSFTNSCGTNVATMAVTVEAAPAMPVISTRSPLVVATGTMYQNYGAATLPDAGTIYTWTADNATVWAQGQAHQYALINFNEPGIAYVTLTATTTSGSCTNYATVTVSVTTDVAQVPEVVYFNNHFVCLPSTENSYQWGYDNIVTLDSSILTGEINQDYVNESPDFGHKLYWVITTTGNSMQKSYYTAPTVVASTDNAASISIFPNPADNVVNVTINATVTGPVQVELFNMAGQKISTVTAADNKAVIDVAGLAAGSYLIICNRNGTKIGGATIIKN